MSQEAQPFVTKDPRSDYFLIGLTFMANTLVWLFFVAQIVCVSGGRGVVINHRPSLHSKSHSFFHSKRENAIALTMLSVLNDVSLHSYASFPSKILYTCLNYSSHLRLRRESNEGTGITPHVLSKPEYILH